MPHPRIEPRGPREKQAASTLLMVRPTRFGYNEQTAANNAFQQKDPTGSKDSISSKAEQEFDTFVTLLRDHGVEVLVFEDTPQPHKPDAIFPNNWFSTHSNGNLVVYPMFAPNRRVEKRSDIIRYFLDRFPETRLLDLREFEEQEKFLEGTGSIVMDRVNQITYACLSVRTHPKVFDWFCQQLEVEGIAFHAVDREGKDIYHTNVMMALGHQVAVICLECIKDPTERALVGQRLRETGHEIVELTYEQLYQFAGNMLEVRNNRGETFMVMSRRAHDSLRADQLETIARSAQPLVIPLDVIETYGGGSVRCMMAEVFLEEKEDGT